ncbi:MAG: hypothetical protein H9W81_07980 [Enterococcus sp.]|nr:hypothetical protein [Enterococcus sp.]
MDKMAKASITTRYIEDSIKMCTIEIVSKRGKPLFVVQSLDSPIAIEKTLKEYGWAISTWKNDHLTLNSIVTSPSAVSILNKEITPPKAVSNPTPNKGGAIGCLVIFIFIIILFGGCTASVSKSIDEEVSKPDVGTEIEAEIMCEEFVKKQLNAPSTAEFSQQKVVTDPQAPTKYRVVGFVEAKNKLGGTSGSSYRCNLEYVPETEEWISDTSLLD